MKNLMRYERVKMEGAQVGALPSPVADRAGVKPAL